MIKSIKVTNYLGKSITLDLRNPSESGLVVKKITGLGPGKADINLTDFSTFDGSRYNSARLSERNIVITLGFLWNSSIEDSRQMTYEYFPIKRAVTLQVETDNRLAAIDGYVESNDPNIFSDKEDTSVSIICPDPFFYSVDEDSVLTKFSSIDPAFEFEFSNESLTEDLLEMGVIQSVTTKNILYEGDVEVGIIITIHAVGDDASNITLYDLTTGGSLYIDTDKLASLTGSGLITGDDIIISTVSGHKYARLLRSGEITNILNCIGKNPDWFKLSKGDNLFGYKVENGQTDIQITIENRVLYEGV